MSETSEATVHIARDTDGDYVIGTGKGKPHALMIYGGGYEWRCNGPGMIGLCSKQMRKTFPILRSMRPGAKPRRLKITMEFEEE